MNVMVAPSPGSAVLPEIVFCLFQLLFCACTVSHAISISRERLLMTAGDDRRWRRLRARRHPTIVNFRLLLGDSCLLSPGPVDME